MKYLLVALVAFVVLAAFVLVWLGRHGRLPSGRLARLSRLGRLSAGLSASWLGASVRRLFASHAGRERIDEARRKADAQRVAETMGQMKGAFMKLGQMMSFVSDDIPLEWRTQLAALQVSAPAMAFPVIRDVLERELRQPLERGFARFDEQALAAASIGQVHAAVLPSGDAVAVKIQYPGVADAIRADLANAGMMTRMIALLYPALDPRGLVDELRDRLTEELDYRREADNQQAFGALYAGHPFVRIPRVHAERSTARVLTTELVVGRRFAEIVGDSQAARSRWGEILFRFVFGSILRHGAFNGDPHPGNYLFDDRGRVAFLDFGCVKRFPPDMLRNWKTLIRAHVEGDRPRWRGLLVELGFIAPACSLDTDLLYDYSAYFYEPFHRDESFTFTPEYNARSLKIIFAPEGRFAGLAKQLNMPRDFVFVNRIQWGLYSLLAQLQARANWYRIMREYLADEPPATELGVANAAHVAAALRPAAG